MYYKARVVYVYEIMIVTLSLLVTNHVGFGFVNPVIFYIVIYNAADTQLISVRIAVNVSIN